MNLALFGILCLIFILSLAMTWLVKKYSLHNELIDIPNHRSSHSVSTPRGGGLSIAIILFLSVLYLYATGFIHLKEVVAIVIPLLAVIVSGWMDDHKHIPSLIRGLIYFLASSWFVLVFPVREMIPGLDSNSFVLYFVLFGISLFFVWTINLYNFMDGIDSLAALEAMTTTAFAVVIFYQMQELELFTISAVMFVSVAGFLYWNWPPAKIFMGDVGSCTIGLFFCILAVLGQQKAGLDFAIWLVLLSVFIADASFTLIKRILKREKWYSAHNQHAYQLLVQSGYSHRFISISITAINVIILWPLAYILAHNSQYTLLIVSINYLFLYILWIGIHRFTGGRIKQAISE